MCDVKQNVRLLLARSEFSGAPCVRNAVGAALFRMRLFDQTLNSKPASAAELPHFCGRKHHETH